MLVCVVGFLLLLFFYLYILIENLLWSSGFEKIVGSSIDIRKSHLQLVFVINLHNVFLGIKLYIIMVLYTNRL